MDEDQRQRAPGPITERSQLLDVHLPCHHALAWIVAGLIVFVEVDVGTADVEVAAVAGGFGFGDRGWGWEVHCACGDGDGGGIGQRFDRSGLGVGDRGRFRILFFGFILRGGRWSRERGTGNGERGTGKRSLPRSFVHAMQYAIKT